MYGWIPSLLIWNYIVNQIQNKNLKFKKTSYTFKYMQFLFVNTNFLNERNHFAKCKKPVTKMMYYVILSIGNIQDRQIHKDRR